MGMQFEKAFITPYISVRIVTTTPDFVDWALSRNTHNRSPHPGTVAAYARDMKEGRWRLVPNGIGFSRDGILIDGRHRLMANREAGYPSVEIFVVTGLELDAQKLVDQHAKRNFAAVCALAFDIARSTAKSGAIRLLTMFEMARARTPAEITAAQVGRPTMSETATTLGDYRDLIESIHCDKARGLGAGFWAVCLYVIRHLPEKRPMVEDFIDRCKGGNGLTKMEPARRWRRFFVEGKMPTEDGRQEQRCQRTTVKYTAALLFAHIGTKELPAGGAAQDEEGKR